MNILKIKMFLNKKRWLTIIVTFLIFTKVIGQAETKTSWLSDNLIQYEIARISNFKIGTIPTYDNQVVTNTSVKNCRKFKRIKRTQKRQLLFDPNRGWATYILILSVYHIDTEEDDVMTRNEYYEKIKSYTEESIEELIKW